MSIAAAWTRWMGSMALLLSGLAAVLPAAGRAEDGVSVGKIDVHFVGLASFPKWTATLQRFDAQLRRCGDGACDGGRWAALLEGLRGLERDALIRAVDRRVNAVRYVPDEVAWRRPDYWATPFEFLEAGGDCEDYAMAKYFALRALGVAAGAMRIAIVWDHTRRLHHAVLLVHEGGATMVLDNLSPRIRRWTGIRNYVPIYSINETGWWLHQAIGEGGAPTLPSLGLDIDAGQASQRVEEIRRNGLDSRAGGGQR
jgi:predicted transglutaminase-like cysteine proteinase